MTKLLSFLSVYKARFLVYAVILAVCLFPGCDSTTGDSDEDTTDPLLRVEAADLAFGESLTQDTFQISNDGQGTLEWTISVGDDGDWCVVEPAEGEGDATITVTVDHKQFSEPGTYSAVITISSNGGSKELTASVIHSTGTIEIDTPLPQ